MHTVNKWYSRLQGYLRLQDCRKGQTMAEYGLILAAIATLCFVAYQLLGGDISALLGAIAGDL